MMHLIQPEIIAYFSAVYNRYLPVRSALRAAPSEKMDAGA